jgi:uncharacterized protein (TIGR02231 family)
MDDTEEVFDSADLRAHYAEARRQDLPNAFEYDLPSAASVDSGDADALFPVFTRPIDGEFSHYAAPRCDRHVYLVCTATPDADLVAGTMNVYMGGRFVGTTAMEEKRPGEPFRLNLGPDRALKLRVEQPSDKEKSKFLGMASGTITRTVERRTVVENLRDTPVTLDLFDAIPVSQTDVYKVKDVALAPDPAERDYDEREGVMRWRLTVAPRETSEVRAKFAVSYPRARPIDL